MLYYRLKFYKGDFQMKVYIMLADGFEETEALVPWDVLKRAGAELSLVSINSEKCVRGAHGITVTADTTIKNISDITPDLIVLPGGMPGTANLAKCDTLCKMLKDAAAHDKPIGAICAAPSVLGELGILRGKRAVCFPGFESKLAGAEISSDPVCRDGNIITARGMGVAFEFAFALTEYLFGAEKAASVKNSSQYIG